MQTYESVKIELISMSKYDVICASEEGTAPDNYDWLDNGGSP